MSGSVDLDFFAIRFSGVSIHMYPNRVRAMLPKRLSNQTMSVFHATKYERFLENFSSVLTYFVACVCANVSE